MIFLAQTPMTWAEIAERLGIPFAILLFIMFAIVWAAAWSAKHVVRPLVNSHVGLNDELKKTLGTVREQEIKQTDQLVELREGQTQLLTKVEDVASHVRQVKGIVARVPRAPLNGGDPATAPT